MNIVWISWCSQRNGRDGRRPSGNSWQRTKYQHASNDGGNTTLCKRQIGPLEKSDPTKPKCLVCDRREKEIKNPAV